MDTTTEQTRDWMTPEEAAKAWGVDRHTVTNWCQRGLIIGAVRKPIGKGRYGVYEISIEARPPEDATPNKGRKRGPKPRVRYRGEDLELIMTEINNKLTPEERTQIEASKAQKYFLLAQSSAAKLFGVEQNIVIALLEHEQANLNAALDFYANEPASAGRELEMAVLLARFWDITGAYAEGRARLLHALHRQDQTPTKLKARGTAWAGHLSFCKDENDAAKKYLIDALNLATELDDKETYAFTLFSRASVAESEGDYRQAVLLFQESIDLSGKLGMEWLTGWSVRWLGVTWEAQGEYTQAKKCYQAYLDISTRMEHGGGIAGAMDHLGSIARREGDHKAARQYLQQALNLRMGGSNRWGVAACHYNLGLLEEADGRPDVAQIHFQKSFEICYKIDERSGIARALEGIGRVQYQAQEPNIIKSPAPEAIRNIIKIFRAAECIRAEISAPRWKEEEAMTMPIMAKLTTAYPHEWNAAAPDQWNAGATPPIWGATLAISQVIHFLLPAPSLNLTDLDTSD